jgi:hypothetical protein
MKPLASSMIVCAVFLAGCTKNPPLAARTQLPNSNLQVVLYGPDAKRHYRYEVLDAGIPVISRPLGPSRIGSYPMAEIDPVNARRVKIQWVGAKASGYTLLDPDARVVVEDSNPANPPNERFHSLKP